MREGGIVVTYPHLIMGAGLAHFIVFALNTDKKECAMNRCAIEISNFDGHKETASRLINRETIVAEIPGWQPTDRVVIVSVIPGVDKNPTAYVLGEDDLVVTCDMPKCGLDAMELKSFRITGGGIDITYTLEEFKDAPGIPEQGQEEPVII
jgi:hypothetical protein